MNEQFFCNRPTFPAQLNMAHPLTRGLIGCWVLNENALDSIRIWDSSPYKNHGTVVTAKGRWQGRWFNASDSYLTVPANAQWNFTGNFFISVWGYLNANNRNIIKSVSDQDWTGVGIATGDWVLDVGGDDKPAFYIKSVLNLAATSTIRIGTWVDIGVGRRGDTVTMYKNGVADGTGTGAGTIGNTKALEIGRPETNLDLIYDGFVGLVRIYNRAFSSAERQRLYLNPYEMFLS